MPSEHDSEFEEWAPNEWGLAAGLGSEVSVASLDLTP
jgi:hypothetical protein